MSANICIRTLICFRWASLELASSSSRETSLLDRACPWFKTSELAPPPPMIDGDFRLFEFALEGAWSFSTFWELPAPSCEDIALLPNCLPVSPVLSIRYSSSICQVDPLVDALCAAQRIQTVLPVPVLPFEGVPHERRDCPFSAHASSYTRSNAHTHRYHLRF